MDTVTHGALSVEAQQTVAEQGDQFTPDDVAALLDEWRPAVLREMGRRQLWRGASAAECEDQFQDVSLILWSRDFASKEHLRRALWTGLGFRARDFWKAARRREVPVGEFFDEVVGDSRGDSVEDAATTAADKRCVDDCLSELDGRERAVYRLVNGDELSRRRVAKQLGLSESDVLRALYSAQRKIDQVVVLLVAGRLCSRRRPAVESLARAEAAGSTLEQARAHLSHCPACLLAFRRERAALGRSVASILPAPAVMGTAHPLERLTAVIDHMRAVPGSAKRTVHDLVRSTPSAGPEEAVAGAGGVALGTKVAVGLCVSAAAGGGALCVDQLGVFHAHSDSHRAATAAQKPRPKHARTRARAAASPAPPMVAPHQQSHAPPGPKTAPSGKAPGPTATAQQHHSSPPEFFGASPKVAGTGAPASSASASPSATPSSSSRPASPSGHASGSGGGGGEFFGG